jgi:hypothetical protein
MRRYPLLPTFLLFFIISLLLNACTLGTTAQQSNYVHYSSDFTPERYAARLPQNVNVNGEKTIVVDPRSFAWGAYGEDGNLVKAGIATAGGDYCPDDGAPCRTRVGTFRISALGDVNCRSHTYPRPEGGALMPYCMFFHGGESLHGSPDRMLVEANVSHGCVHLRIPDAEWIRYNFAQVGTKVVVMPY